MFVLFKLKGLGATFCNVSRGEKKDFMLFVLLVLMTVLAYFIDSIKEKWGWDVFWYSFLLPIGLIFGSFYFISSSCAASYSSSKSFLDVFCCAPQKNAPFSQVHAQGTTWPSQFLLFKRNLCTCNSLTFIRWQRLPEFPTMRVVLPNYESRQPLK